MAGLRFTAPHSTLGHDLFVQARAKLWEALSHLTAMDPEAFYVVDRFAQTNGHTPPPRPGGWWLPGPRPMGWRLLLKAK